MATADITALLIHVRFWGKADYSQGTFEMI